MHRVHKFSPLAFPVGRDRGLPRLACQVFEHQRRGASILGHTAVVEQTVGIAYDFLKCNLYACGEVFCGRGSGLSRSLIRCCSHPSYFAVDPAYATGPEFYPLWKTARLLQTIDLRGRVQHDRPQFFLREDAHGQRLGRPRVAVNTV